MAPKPAPKKTPPPKSAAAAPKPAPASKKTTPTAKPKVAESPPVSAAKAKSPPVSKKVAPADEKKPVSAAKSEVGGSSVKSPAAVKVKLPELAAKTEEKKPVSVVKSPVRKVAVAKVKSPSVSKEKVKVEEAKAVNDENKTVYVAKSPESGKASTTQNVEEVKVSTTQKVEEVKAEDPLPKVEENCKEEEPKVEAEAVTAEQEAVTAEQEPMENEGTEQEPVVVPMEEDIEKGVVEESGDDMIGEEGGEEVEDEDGEGEEEDDGEDGDEEEEEEVEEEEPEAEVERLVAEVEEQAEISDMVKARKMKKQHEIFVGGLDRDAVEDDLRKVFEKVGEVVEIRLHKEFATQKNKGFAFVKFANKEQVAKAFSELKNPLIRGKRCGIVPSEDNDTLFLGNICNTWTKEAIKTKLKDYGIHNCETVTLVVDSKNEGLSRGFAFLEFACHADAMLAYKRLQKPDAKFGHPLRTAKVAFGEPIQDPDPEVMAQVKQVFIDGLPPYWDEDRVKEQFKGYGEIESVTLARNMSSARRKDFGFVNFTTHEAAVACSEGADGTELGDGKLKMKVKARLSNPQPKAQAVKGGMAGGYRIGHNGIGVYSKFGRGYSRGKSFPGRTAVQRGRSLNLRGRGRGNLRGRGRGGRFAHVTDNTGSSNSEFHGRRPFGIRGGRVSESTRGGASRGRGRPFPPRRQPYALEEDYDTPYNARFVGDDPYIYVDGGGGFKRPFPMMEQDPDYLEFGSRVRPRYEHPDSVARRYRGSSGLYSRDYDDSDYGDRTYSSRFGGGQTGRGYYY